MMLLRRHFGPGWGFLGPHTSNPGFLTPGHLYKNVLSLVPLEELVGTQVIGVTAVSSLRGSLFPFSEMVPLEGWNFLF